MLTYMFLFNSGIAGAHNLPDVNASEIGLSRNNTTEEKEKHAKNFETKISRLADKLGLDPEAIKADADAGKTVKEILKKYGITKNQLKEIRNPKRKN